MLASWYTRLSRLGVFDRSSPFAPGVLERPFVDPDHSDSIGLSETEAVALLRAVRTDRGRQAKRTRALIAVLLTCGARVAEIAAADAGQLTADAGHRVLPLMGKGGNFFGSIDVDVEAELSKLDGSGYRPLRNSHSSASVVVA